MIPTTNTSEGRRQWNIGDFVHFLEVAALLVSIGINYGRFTQIQIEVSAHNRTLTRIERYLSAQDPNYWPKVKQYGDDGGGDN